MKLIKKKNECCKVFIRIGTFEQDNYLKAEIYAKENIPPPPFLPYCKFTYVLGKNDLHIKATFGNQKRNWHIKDTFTTNQEKVSTSRSNIKDTLLPLASNPKETGTNHDIFTSAFFNLIKEFYPRKYTVLENDNLER